MNDNAIDPSAMVDSLAPKGGPPDSNTEGSSICGIYGIWCEANERWYVGQSDDIYRRWLTHLRELSGNRHRNQRLQRAWLKYGAASFAWVILEKVPKQALPEKRTRTDRGLAGAVPERLRADSRRPAPSHVRRSPRQNIQNADWAHLLGRPPPQLVQSSTRENNTPGNKGKDGEGSARAKYAKRRPDKNIRGADWMETLRRTSSQKLRGATPPERSAERRGAQKYIGCLDRAEIVRRAPSATIGCQARAARPSHFRRNQRKNCRQQARQEIIPGTPGRCRGRTTTGKGTESCHMKPTSELTDEELRITLAGLLGWTNIHLATRDDSYKNESLHGWLDSPVGVPPWYRGRNPVENTDPIPTFESDLNACHEAERQVVCPDDGWRIEYYKNLLRGMCMRAGDPVLCPPAIFATARQRTEALVQVLRKRGTE